MVKRTESLNCYVCGESGHISRGCPKRHTPETLAVASSSLKQPERKHKTRNLREKRPAHGSLSTHLRSWCCKIDGEATDSFTETYWKPCFCDVIVFGLRTRALIDTGSVISIVPVRFLECAQSTGLDLDNLTTVTGDGNENEVFDASGNPMKFLLRIAVPVEVCGAQKAVVQMHVQQTTDEIIMLGTNALDALGIQVKLKPENDASSSTIAIHRRDEENNIRRSKRNDSATIDFRCPGIYRHQGQDLKCSVGKPWSEIIPDAPVPYQTGFPNHRSNWHEL
ncbi:zinc knuckle [Oesophagostomum dentatum]|uniref:Zinc knuckle n=1 Tax=Oesophagostomum dentatum TaxID=61180 RepID=A0A0B1TT23_OESDE|nr:zinc knuckle [Oesophagostomum dentatum]